MRKITATLLALFGLLTLFLSGSILFDFFDIRAKQGNYVSFVVWSNFVCSLFYLLASYGLITSKKWAAHLLIVPIVVLIASFIGFNIHANSNGLHETKTFGALIFRISFTLIFTFLAYAARRKKKV